MPAYLIGDIDIHDEAGFAAYRAPALEVVRRFGGRTIAIDKAPLTLEGDWASRDMIVIEFPDMEAIRALFASPDYAPLIAARQASARSRLIAVQGLA
ncbi:DUF1330 domain-containing protein [Rhodovarius crocodyli]|uniref:DUF1330 domain-containing protein n=1 Tax=Rhodovarius crocodyli TaxID=1979269 RepID=A0A437MH26_9PROT|nr:DUF1330 domain-containing protein [Rhodovarius crocodyli]RVT96936.1 DUF1330 domain-containing protein [Rhodovarius crocodyli]